MIERPTVLILGAGASMPYGFPSGRDLMDGIISHLDPKHNSEMPSTLKKFGITDDTLKDFFRSLAYSGRLSVDEFLEHQPEYLKVGKLAISLCLIPYEEESRLFRSKHGETLKKESWYEYLFNELKTPFDSFNENKLSIITFNYDRSIEHYLFTVLKNAYGKSDDECAEKLSKIPIIHVYGRLGALPWQGGITRKYEPEPFYDEIESVSEQIKIFTEVVDNSKEFKEARGLMRNAKFIYFLGFGYHNDNLNRLEAKKFDKIHPRGTAHGLGESRIDKIQGDWGIELSDCKVY